MKGWYILLIVLVLLSSCTGKDDNSTDVGKDDNSIIVLESDLPYDRSIKLFDWDSGIVFTAYDKVTNKRIPGYGLINSTGRSAGFFSENVVYFNSSDSYVTIFYYPFNHPPYKGKFKLNPGRLTNITVKMGGENIPHNYCLESLRMQSEIFGEPEYTSERANNRIKFVMEKAGFLDGEWEFENLGCFMIRGDSIKGDGKLNQNNRFQVYFKSGYCSLGGYDCGFTKCVSTDSDELLTRIKKAICPMLSYGVSDSTDEAIQSCLNGEFDQEYEGMKTLSLVQTSNRDSRNFVTIGTANCLEY